MVLASSAGSLDEPAANRFATQLATPPAPPETRASDGIVWPNATCSKSHALSILSSVDMLPSSTVSTSVIINISTWLAQTALSYGFALRSAKPAPNSLDPDRASLTAEQIKAEKNRRKKERKKTREDAQVGNENAASVEDLGPGDYLLSLPEFVSIAKYLVAKHAEVPLAFMRLMSRCIRARTQTMKGFADLPDTQGSNETHQHFIGVLQEVAAVLSPCVRSHKTTHDEKSTKGDGPALDNQFSELHVEEEVQAEEEEDIALPTPTGPANTPTTIRRHFAPQPTFFDAITTAFGFLVEVYHFRQDIRDIWTSYREHKVDLVVASVATNTSLEVLAKLHDDVVENALPFFNNDVSKLMLATLAYLVIRDDQSIKTFRPRQFYDLSFSKADARLAIAYDLSLVPYLQMLEYLEEIAEEDQTPSADFDVESAYEPDLLRTKPKASIVERWQNAQIVITDAYYHYVLVAQSSEELRDDKHQAGHFLGLDALAKEIEALLKRQKVSMLGCAHAAIYSDINMTLGSESRRAYAEFRRECMAMGWSARKQVAHDENGWGLPKEDGEKDKELQSLTELLIFYGTRNPVEGFRVHMEQSDKGRRVPYQLQFVQNPGNTFMDRSPMFCGVLLLHFRLWFRRLGLSISNEQWKTIPMAMLWKACRIHGKDEGATQLEAWPELEALGDIHGEANMFGGKVPTTLFECQLGILTAKGAPPEALGLVKHEYSDGDKPSYLKNMRKKGVPLEMDGRTGVFFQCKTPKPLKDVGATLSIFATRYLDCYARRDVSLDLDGLRAKLPERPSAGDVAIDPRPADPEITARKLEDADEVEEGDGSQEWEDMAEDSVPPTTSPYTPLSILSIVSSALQQEHAQLYTDYMALNVASIGIIWAVDDALPDYFGHWPPITEQSLPDLVEKILDFAADAEKAGAENGVSTLALQQRTIRWDIMEKTVRAINDMLKEIKEGEAERVQMREDRCKELDGPKVARKGKGSGTGLKAQRKRFREITKMLREL